MGGRIALESWQGSQGSPHAWLVLRFLVTCSGASCRVLKGQLISSRDVQCDSCLVAVTGECSLDLSRDYSIVVVWVHSVVAGV